ncbi:hypothetical protein [Streptomyces sp. NBC_01198]|uniref:hypothetical protein n=1 Tax=Streptomyces sp. NBC_01198 TaxID=2903769 RepID=UPI002E15E7D6|nr:hypothetical protein OG702_11170 [Streptomyces sp. NBC_01198]
MSYALAGMIYGIALGFAGWFVGFGAFVVVAVVGAVGALAGGWAEGGFDPVGFFRSRVLDRDRDRR